MFGAERPRIAAFPRNALPPNGKGKPVLPHLCACAPVRLCASSSACAPVRPCACAPVRPCACAPVPHSRRMLNRRTVMANHVFTSRLPHSRGMPHRRTATIPPNGGKGNISQFNINPMTKATVRPRGRVSGVAGGGGGEPES